MSNLVNYTPIPIPTILTQINQFKYNPSAIQRTILDNLYQYTNGQADVVDPTNPFVFLLESSCVNTSAAIQESLVNLQKQYPALAQSFDDLYLHMSDLDYLNVFAQPAQTTFTWKIQLQPLLNAMVADPAESCKKAIIMRNSYVTVATMAFSLNYPIVIRQYDNGYIEVAYDASQPSPIQQLQTNIIPYVVITDASSVEWLAFDVPMMQFNLQSTSFTIQASTILNQNIDFTGQFYYARAFYQNSTNTPNWTEILTTYTQEIYDATEPTVALQVDVDNSVLNVFLPPVYVDTNLISGILRIDLYTTEGQVSINLSNYQVNSFVSTFFSTDPSNDVNAYSSVLPNVSYVVYSANTIAAGSDGQNFNELRQNVINNATGSVQIPITNIQLLSQAQIDGFQIVKNVDIVTNRQFQATQALPNPSNPALITPAALTLNTLYITQAQLQASNVAINNVTQSTIPSKTVFVENNGQLSLYDPTALATLLGTSALNIANTVNATNFLYTPFHYVLDYSGSEFSLKAYDLDDPSCGLINFIEQNETLQLIVNTGNIQIQKTYTGFQITVTTSSGPMYQQLPDAFVQVQLGFIPVGETHRAYTNGTLIGKTSTNERIFQFNLTTNYFINQLDQINFTNLFMYNTSVINVLADMLQTMDIFYTTTSITTGYIPIASDNYIGRFMLPPNAAVVTHEQVDVQLGFALENLWTQSLVNEVGQVYETYPQDVAKTYTTDQYQIDPTTNSIFTVDTTNNTVTFNILHHAGDPVLDANGNPVYLHRAGDPVLDAIGNPVINTAAVTQYACDLTLVDGKYFFVTDPAYVSYRKELRNVIVTWVTQNLPTLANQLLEQTQIFYYPAKAYSTVTVNLDVQTQANISAAQSFMVDIYLTSSAYNDATLRAQYENVTIATINQQLQNNTVSISAIIEALQTVYDNNVISFNVSGLGGAQNYNTVTLANQNESLSLNKILTIQEDGTLIVREDVTINFHNYQVS
jgi:hypothetical protein